MEIGKRREGELAYVTSITAETQAITPHAVDLEQGKIYQFDLEVSEFSEDQAELIAQQMTKKLQECHVEVKWMKIESSGQISLQILPAVPVALAALLPTIILVLGIVGVALFGVGVYLLLSNPLPLILIGGGLLMAYLFLPKGLKLPKK